MDSSSKIFIPRVSCLNRIKTNKIMDETKGIEGEYLEEGIGMRMPEQI
jgi:hypothetical protein